jgi:hypothetical protein
VNAGLNMRRLSSVASPKTHRYCAGRVAFTGDSPRLYPGMRRDREIAVSTRARAKVSGRQKAPRPKPEGGMRLGGA